MAISKTKPWMSAELVATDIDRNLMKVGSVSTCRIIALINVLSMLVCTHIICIESPSCMPHSPPPTTMKIHATVIVWLHDIGLIHKSADMIFLNNEEILKQPELRDTNILNVHSHWAIVVWLEIMVGN